MSGIQIITAFLALTSHCLAYASNNTEILEVDRLRYDFFEFEDKLEKNVSDKGQRNGSRGSAVVAGYQKFGNEIQERMMPSDIGNGFRILEELSLKATHSDLRKVQAVYKTFREFLVNRTVPLKEAWRDFNRTLSVVITEDFELASLENVAYLTTKRNLFGHVAGRLTTEMMCDLRQSHQQILHSLYNAIALAELEGHMMIRFSFMMNSVYGQSSFETIARSSREVYQKRSNGIREALHKVIASSSRAYWRCDPEKHVTGKTYVEVTRLLQGYISAEVCLNREGTCKDECSDYEYLDDCDRPKNGKCGHNKKISRQNGCIGRIMDCESMKGTSICLSEDSSTYRRYQRKNKKCNSTTVSERVEWTVFPFYRTCSYCFCLCDEKHLSDRYVNMRPALADTKNNRVVTGLKFVKRNQIIHLQIQEAKLLPYGRIDSKTIHWVPVDNYTKDDKPKVYAGQDYHVFSWNRRAIDLDDIETGEGFLVTGVRFRADTKVHLQLEILFTSFDFDKGILIGKSFNETYPIDPLRRSKIELRKPDIPTLSDSPSVPDSTSGQYVELVNSDFDKDLGQTTVPFFDAQPVETAQPLGGAGIFHKGRAGFGGFIAPKLFTYDFSRHMQKALSKTESERKSQRRD